jgi:hypothetical protein
VAVLLAGEEHDDLLRFRGSVEGIGGHRDVPLCDRMTLGGAGGGTRAWARVVNIPRYLLPSIHSGVG